MSTRLSRLHRDIARQIAEKEDELCIEILNHYHRFNIWKDDGYGNAIGFCIRCELWILHTDNNDCIIKTIEEIHDS